MLFFSLSFSLALCHTPLILLTFLTNPLTHTPFFPVSLSLSSHSYSHTLTFLFFLSNSHLSLTHHSHKSLPQLPPFHCPLTPISYSYLPLPHLPPLSLSLSYSHTSLPFSLSLPLTYPHSLSHTPSSSVCIHQLGFSKFRRKC